MPPRRDEVDALEDLECAEALVQVPDLDDGCGRFVHDLLFVVSPASELVVIRD
jgi:hypothetical protein